MKEILKTLPPELEMKYEQVFGSSENKSIRQKLVPELFRALQPRFKPSYGSIKEWLRALHKHRRDSYLLSKKGSQDRTNRRIHNNNRITEVWSSYFFFFAFIN
jgi:hypothetical protein